MLILFFILSILIYPIMAKAQIEFQGEWPYICLISCPIQLTLLDFQDLQKVVFDWADSYDSKVSAFKYLLTSNLTI